MESIRKDKKKDSDRYVMHSQNQLSDQQANDLKFMKRLKKKIVSAYIYMHAIVYIFHTFFVYNIYFFHLSLQIPRYIRKEKKGL